MAFQVLFSNNSDWFIVKPAVFIVEYPQQSLCKKFLDSKMKIYRLILDSSFFLRELSFFKKRIWSDNSIKVWIMKNKT